MDLFGDGRPVRSSIRVLTPTSTHADASPSSTLLQQLFALADGFPEVKQLVWDPLEMYEGTVQASQVVNFQEQLGDWVTGNKHVFSHLDPEIFGKPTTNCDWTDVDTLPIPPPPYSTVPSGYCFLIAIHSFYMARTHWALSLSDLTPHSSETHYLTAYNYLYNLMRASATIIGPKDGITSKVSGSYLASETLGIGLLPLLYTLGPCTPRPTWLRHLMESMLTIKQEGLFNGDVLAKSLNALYTFEMSNNLDSSSMLDRFPSPSERVVCVLLPQLDGQSYVAYYASSLSSSTSPNCARQRFPIGHARWSNVRRGGTTKPDIEIYNAQTKRAEPFTREWVLKQTVAVDWMGWAAGVKGFNFGRALNDHISGSCLENAVYEQGFR
jgi:hypothetical protein